MTNKHRCFLAVRVPAFYEVQKTLDHYQNDLKIKLKIVDPVLYHYTLHFFGDISQEEIEIVQNAFNDFHFDPFSLAVENVGYIPNNKPAKARVLYLSCTKGEYELVELAKRVRSIVSQNKFKVKKQSFLPHLTVARVKSGYDIQKAVQRWLDYEFQVITHEVNEIELIKSELTSTGPTYSTLFKFGNLT